MNMQYFKKETQKIDFALLEEEILELWDREKTFERSVDQREGCDKFIFIEGPPTANGLPHPGHILTRVVKDLVLRYKTMCGFHVQRKAGWDTHGLPVEIEVEKELGLSSKHEVEKYGIERFNQRCKDSVFKYEKEWVNATKRVGFWIDMDDPYITFDNGYIESVWWSLREIWDKGLLYKGHKVVPFCPRCETALSTHEVAQGYQDLEETSIYVKFRVKQESSSPVYLLAWTTTPWTLLGNIALAVHPSETYVRVKQKQAEEVLIIAEARLDLLEGDVDGEYEILERFTGEDMEDLNLEYEPLFRFAKIEGGWGGGGGGCEEVGDDVQVHKVITADFVTLEEGTGIVHIAPAFGEVDYEVCRQKKLGFSQPVRSDGRFTADVPPLEGIFVKDADRLIIEMLKQDGKLYKEAMYLHSYPFCWRCDSPLLYYARESWFIAMETLRDKLLANNEKINWYPSHLKYGRFGDFLRDIKDWALSRERFWGTPLNIWICQNTGCGQRYCVGSVAELRERAKTPFDREIDLHRPYIDDVILRCDECGGDMHRVEDVIDCWYDSGSAPFAQWHYPFEEEIDFRENFPAHFITEAIDQTRGWFYSLLGVSTAIFDRPAYLNVLSLGHILDEKGVKMSKRKGNVVEMNELFETGRRRRSGTGSGTGTGSADALRWYLFTTSPVTEDIRFSVEAIREKQKKFLNTLWNSYFFFVTYANIDEFNPGRNGNGNGIGISIPVAQRNLIDRWLISRLNRLNRDVVDALERFEIHIAARKIEEFVIDELSNWYIRRSRRRFWITEENFDKDCAYLTLYEVIVSVCKLLAPFLPFVSEHIYQNLVRGAIVTDSEERLESVHLCDYPSPDESVIEPELEEAMELISKLVEAGRRMRSDAGIKIRQPLKEVLVICSCSKEKRERTESLAEILKEELNVHEVRFDEVPDERALSNYKRAMVGVNDGDGTYLFLDCSPCKNLIEEGLVRDIVRRIQGMRKELDLEYTEKIELIYACDDEVKEAIVNFSDYICTETLAVCIEEKKNGDEAEDEDGDEEVYWKTWKIGGKVVRLAIKRITKRETKD